MGQKSSKQSGQWPYAYPPSSYGQPAAPFYPPNFQPQPGQAYPAMSQPVIPHMYGQGWPPQEKGFFGRKRRGKSYSEHYPGGYMPFPQPQVAPPTNTAVVPDMPSRRKTRKKPPPPMQMPEPDASTARPNRTGTPFIPNQRDDSDDTSEEEDDPRRRRTRRSAHRRRARSEEYLPFTADDPFHLPPAPHSAAPLRNPLPPPPKDLYEMTPYKSLLTLPQTTALLTAINGAQNAKPATTVTHLPGGLQQAASAPAQPAAPAKKKSLFRRLTSSKRHSSQQKQAPPNPAVVPNPVQFVYVPTDKNSGHPAITSSGHRTQASTSTSAPQDPKTPQPDTANFSTAGIPSGAVSGGFQTGTSGGMGAPSPAPTTSGRPSASPRPSTNDDPTSPIRFSQLDPTYSGFMNHSAHRVIYQNQIYPTATHVHEAMKYIDHRPDLADTIRNCHDVLRVYPLSASYLDQQRGDWGQVFLDKMEEVLELKFGQHPDLRAKLLSTHPRPLVYADERDGYWGQGPDGLGENMLGKILMHVRDKLRQAPTYAVS